MNRSTRFQEQSAVCIDERITSTCFVLGDWPLSRVLLKNNAEYPWLILVPRVEGIQDIEELSQEARYQLTNEISHLSGIVRTHFNPDKINVAYLGNIVSQLHVHVVARFRSDSLWPHGIWQASQKTSPYTESALHSLLNALRSQINSSSFLYKDCEVNKG